MLYNGKEEGIKLNLYLQEYRPRKLNKLKTSIMIVVFLGIMCAIVVMASQEEKQREDREEVVSVIANETEEQQVVNTKKVKMPIYTAEAKEKLDGIYQSNGEKRAFLTFDDGPSASVTPLILEVLKQNNIKATFFMLGSKVDANPEIAKRVYEEGHYVANHGYSHVYSKIYKSPENVLTEYEQCNYSISQAIGIPNYTTKLFRFPGGLAGGIYADIKEQAAKILEENGIAHVDWNCLTQDSAGKFTKEELFRVSKRYF